VSDVSDLLADSVTRLFREGSAQRTATAEFDTALWNQTQEMGLWALLVSEDQGGIGGSWEDALAVLQPAGFYAIALPVAENMLACRLLAAARLESDALMAVAAPGEGALQKRRQGFRFSGSFHSLPWGRNAKSIVTCVVLDETPHVVVLPSDGATLQPATNLAGEPRDELRFDALRSRRAKKMNLSSKPWPAISSPLGQVNGWASSMSPKNTREQLIKRCRIIGWQSLNTVDNWPLAATKTRRLNWRKKHSGCARVRYVGCRWTRRFGVWEKDSMTFAFNYEKPLPKKLSKSLKSKH